MAVSIIILKEMPTPRVNDIFKILAEEVLLLMMKKMWRKQGKSLHSIKATSPPSVNIGSERIVSFKMSINLSVFD
mgnify:CR=1 FL=1